MAENNQEVKVETPKKKRNWLFTLFACVATGVIVYLAINIGNNASKTVDPDVNKSCDKVSNSNIESNSNEIIDSNSNSTVENNTTSSIDSSKLRNNFILDSSKNNDKSVSYNISLASYGSYDGNSVSVVVKSPYTSATIGDKTVNFDKKVIEVLFTGFGQATGSETILFLMEDGTVEYIPYRKALTGEMKSYGAIPNVTDVVKLFVGASETIGGSVNIIAQRADGTFYLLDSNLNATGNYN